MHKIPTPISRIFDHSFGNEVKGYNLVTGFTRRATIEKLSIKNYSFVMIQSKCDENWPLLHLFTKLTFLNNPNTRIKNSNKSLV